MTPRMIQMLLSIASEANRWPRLKHLREEALRELEIAHLSVIDHIVPVAIVDINQQTNGANDHAQQTGRGTGVARDARE